MKSLLLLLLFIFLFTRVDAQNKISYDSLIANKDSILSSKKKDILLPVIRFLRNTMEKNNEIPKVMCELEIGYLQINYLSGTYGDYFLFSQFKQDSILLRLLNDTYVFEKDSMIKISAKERSNAISRNIKLNSFFGAEIDMTQQKPKLYLEICEPIGGWQDFYLTNIVNNMNSGVNGINYKYLNTYMAFPVLIFYHADGSFLKKQAIVKVAYAFGLGNSIEITNIGLVEL